MKKRWVVLYGIDGKVEAFRIDGKIVTSDDRAEAQAKAEELGGEVMSEEDFAEQLRAIHAAKRTA
jgi:hypothetical protein